MLGEQSVDEYREYINQRYGALENKNSPSNATKTAAKNTPVSWLSDTEARLIDSKHLDRGRLVECVSNPKTIEIVEASEKEGTAAGVSATPTFFVNGERVVGALSEDALWKVIERAERYYSDEHASREDGVNDDRPRPAADSRAGR